MCRQHHVIFIVIVLLSSLSLNTQISSAQMPPPQISDEMKYIGFDYGCVGIVSTLFGTQSHNSQIDVNATIERCLDQVWNSRIEDNGEKIVAWGKYPNSSLIYPGHKYGAVGIALTFLQYYDITGSEIWLNRSIEIYNSIMDQSLNKTTLPHWNYAYSLPQSPSGVSITDIKYGSGGILKLNLELYKQTRNETLLEEGNRIIDWIKSTTNLIDISGIKYNVIPWYDFGEIDEPVQLSYEWGLSGLGPLLYDYGNIMNSTDTKNFGREQILFTQSVQFTNGSWSSEFGIDLIQFGFDQGIAGILYGMNQMNNMEGLSTYNHTIQRGIDYIFDNIIQNDTHFGFPYSSENPIFYYNYASGLIGVLQTLINLDYYLTSDQKETVVRGIEYLLNKQSLIINFGNLEGLVLKNDWLESGVFDFSLADGLAGLLNLIVSIPSDYRNLTDLDLDVAQELATNTLSINQDNDGLWPKQKNLSHYLPEGYFDINVQTTGESKTISTTDQVAWLTPNHFFLILITNFLIFRRKKWNQKGEIRDFNHYCVDNNEMRTVIDKR